MTTERLVYLKCESDRPSYDQSTHVVILEQETPRAWIGYPLEWRERGISGIGPIIYPKFAWKEIFTA